MNPKEIYKDLIEEATAARSRAYAPYSKFAVGAALLAKSGRVFRGANVENISFGLTICAERVCVGAALQSDERNWDAIAIVAGSDLPVVPCGACRQVLAEFCPDLVIISSTLGGDWEEFQLEVMLPKARQGILK